MAFPKKDRIVREKDIQNALKFSQKAETKWFRLRFSWKNTGNFRILVTIPKKVSKKATKRNRLRRQTLAIFENMRNSQNLPPKLDLVIVGKSSEALNKNQVDLKDDLMKVYQQLVTQKLHKNKKFVFNPNHQTKA